MRRQLQISTIIRYNRMLKKLLIILKKAVMLSQKYKFMKNIINIFITWRKFIVPSI